MKSRDQSRASFVRYLEFSKNSFFAINFKTGKMR